jgi:hypothetical protein
MALTQQVSTVNEMANSTNSLIKRITEIKEKYDNFMKE